MNMVFSMMENIFSIQLLIDASFLNKIFLHFTFYVLYTVLLISKLFLREGLYGWVGGRGTGT
jgi:hypothetical protein